MTATLPLSPLPHANLHLVRGAVRVVHVTAVDEAEGIAWVHYAGDGDVSSVGVTYGVELSELRSGELDHPLQIALGEAQREVACYRFEDVRDGSEGDATLGAELDGYRLNITNLADALDTLTAALEIVNTWTGAEARREQRATASLRAKLVKLAAARAAARAAR